MQLSALSCSLLLFAGISAVFGMVTGKTELFAAAAGCIAVPAVCIFNHLGEVKKAIAALEFSRRTDAEILRQNGEVVVSAQLTPEDALISSVTFEDLIPAGAHLTRGSTVFQQGRAEYAICLPAAGASYFRGIRVSAATIFGRFTFTLDNAVNPKLTAYATGTAALTVSAETEYADKARDRHAIIPSGEVRDFRAFHEGDNIRDLDWKQTLHHDELYVRLKMDSHINSPLLILDLPDTSASAEDTAKFTAAANSALKFCSGFDDASVVFTCKGNIIETLSLKESIRVSQTLFTAGMREPSIHLYHERHRHELIHWITQIQTISSEKYHARLLKILHAAAKRADGEFERQSKRLFLQKQNADFAVAVSNAAGDISHLLYLVHDASDYLQEISVYLSGVRERPDCDEIADKLKKAGASYVEVVS
ncbi:MAG TPA: DUF58 domain-containing protein [Methanocorpusculum sp.]|nr:DUF58 domain-containing protein [Methanocorpusculum sp.]